MASIAFPALAKKQTLSDGVTYGWVAVAPSSPSKPTFLFLHGYPSSSFDWRKQIESLPKLGFGVIVPDLLGYGDTDKPVDLEAYKLKTMSRQVAEILTIEGVSKCFMVSHDWQGKTLRIDRYTDRYRGSGLASRLATYHRERFYGMITVSVSYVEPGLVWDIDGLNKLTEQMFGYATYGYWPWHNSEEAVQDCNDHPASVFTMIYPAVNADWKVNFAPVGAAKEYVQTGKVDPLPSWYSLADYTTRDRIFSTGGYRGPMSWYKAAMQGLNDADDAEIPEHDKKCPLPTLLVVSDEDYVTRADLQSMQSQKWVPQLRIEKLDCGHWIQLERPEKLQNLVVGFANEIQEKITGSKTVIEQQGFEAEEVSVTANSVMVPQTA